MHQLYEVPHTIETVLDDIVEGGGEIKVHHRIVLDALKDDFDAAVDNCCRSIRNSESRVTALKLEIVKLQELADAEQCRADAAEKIVMEGILAMENRAQGAKFGKVFKASLRDNPPSAEIVLPADVPDEYVAAVLKTGRIDTEIAALIVDRYPKVFEVETVYNKKAITEYWKAHDKQESPPGTSVQQRKRLVIS